VSTLTDKQYLDLLLRARENLNQIDFAKGYDDTTVGNKSTLTNVGLCNNELCTKEIAMWPKQFESGRRDIKYRNKKHKCPLDSRIGSKEDYNWSCFYHCIFFQENFKDIEKMKILYNEQIKITQKRLNKEDKCQN
jgi:hypothetical protein